MRGLRDRNTAETAQVYRVFRPMEDHEPDRLVERLRRWWRRADRDEEYLAAATDYADLKRRIHVLERGSGGPQLVTTMSEWRPGRSRPPDRGFFLRGIVGE